MVNVAKGRADIDCYSNITDTQSSFFKPFGLPPTLPGAEPLPSLFFPPQLWVQTLPSGHSPHQCGFQGSDGLCTELHLDGDILPDPGREAGPLAMSPVMQFVIAPSGQGPLLSSRADPDGCHLIFKALHVTRADFLSQKHFCFTPSWAIL